MILSLYILLVVTTTIKYKLTPWQGRPTLKLSLQLKNNQFMVISRALMNQFSARDTWLQDSFDLTMTFIRGKIRIYANDEVKKIRA